MNTHSLIFTKYFTILAPASYLYDYSSIVAVVLLDFLLLCYFCADLYIWLDLTKITVKHWNANFDCQWLVFDNLI